MNNQNAGTVIGPILIPTDGSYTSLFVDELPGWLPGTFSEAFNGTANLTLNVPNQQSATEALLEPLFIAVVGPGNEFQLTAAPPYGGRARHSKRSESAPECRGELEFLGR